MAHRRSSPKAPQQDFRNGICLKVTDKSSHFMEVNKELVKNCEKFSDVKIVCRNGDQLNANRAFLAQIPRLSQYLQLPEVQSEKETWLFLPEINSKWVKLFLGWLYGASLSLSDLKNPEFRMLQELLGVSPYEAEGPIEVEDEPSFEDESVEEAQDEDESFWETFWAEEQGEYKCPIYGESSMHDQIQNHIDCHGLLAHPSDEDNSCVVRNKTSKSSKTNEPLSDRPKTYEKAEPSEGCSNENYEKTSLDSHEFPEELDFENFENTSLDGHDYAEGDGSKAVKNEPLDTYESTEVNQRKTPDNPTTTRTLSRPLQGKRLKKDSRDLVCQEPFTICQKKLNLKRRQELSSLSLSAAQAWRPSFRLQPTPGFVYVFKGNDADFPSICEADGISWRNKAIMKDNAVRKSIIKFFTAIPDISRMTSEQKFFYFGTDVTKELVLRKMYLGHIKYRKKVTRDRSTGLFIIEYLGDDKILPWKTK